MDFTSFTIAQLLQILSIPTAYATGIGLVLLILRYFGVRLFKSIFDEAIKKYYEENLSKVVDSRIDTKIVDTKKEIKEDFEKDLDRILDNHSTKCKNSSLEHNDQRYLLRQEFKMFLESQAKTNEKLELAISEIRSVCNQILLKLTE